MMRNTLMAVGVAALASLSSTALADGTVHTGGTYQGVAGTGMNGGAFTFTLGTGWGTGPTSVIEAGNGSVFLTFCIETGEHLSLNTTYNASVDSFVTNGLSSHGVYHTTLEPETAYLYSEFRAGTLSGYTGSAASQAGLQAAMWYLQGQINAAEWTSAQGFNSLATTFYTAATASGWTDIGNVRVLNLYDGGGAHQSALTLVPLPAETAMAGISLMGMFGIRVIRRRRA